MTRERSGGRGPADLRPVTIQPGFVSTVMHRPVGGSRLWVNYAVWDSASAFAAALASPEFREAAAPMKKTGFRRLYQAMPALDPIR